MNKKYRNSKVKEWKKSNTPKLRRLRRKKEKKRIKKKKRRRKLKKFRSMIEKLDQKRTLLTRSNKSKQIKV